MQGKSLVGKRVIQRNWDDEQRKLYELEVLEWMTGNTYKFHIHKNGKLYNSFVSGTLLPDTFDVIEDIEFTKGLKT